MWYVKLPVGFKVLNATICSYLYIYIYVQVCMECMYVYIYIYIYTFHRSLRLSPDDRMWNTSKIIPQQTRHINLFIHSLVFSLEGRAWQEPEPSHVTGISLAHCILGKFLGVVCHCFPPPLDVPTLVARCLRPQRRERS